VTWTRDPLSELLDGPAQSFLTRAYADYGNWVYSYLPPPSTAQRAAAFSLGLDPDAADPYGHEPNAWVRAFKRSARWNLRMYGYARELRPGDRRVAPGTFTTLMIWDSTGGLVSRPPVGQFRHQIKIRLYPNSSSWLGDKPRAADDWPNRRAAWP
jgi:hypothetical protein